MTRWLPPLAVILACACGASHDDEPVTDPDPAAADRALVDPPSDDAGAPPDDNAASDAGPDGTPDDPIEPPATDAGPDAPSIEPEPESPACGPFAAVANVDADGPLAVTSESAGSGCTLYRPATLEDDVRYPIILWGNGTSAPLSVYDAAFEYWASYGFVVLAANDLDGQGSGAPQLACLDWLLAEAATSGSVWEDQLCDRVAASGHSQGGAGAIMAGTDPRVTVTAPVQPYTAQGWGGFDGASISTQSASPMLLLSGTLDNNAVPSIYQQPVFDDTNVPVFWANRVGADHYTAVLGLTKYKTLLLEWFRLTLLDDEAFHDVFYGASCALCDDNSWIVQRSAGF